ncbi:MAG: hypothetical protein NDF54_03615 [archaeon GB-1867-035]|nr:hypothetical protein [Candidatus Culexmicrobium profundum]
MKYAVALRVENIERTETSGILLISLSGIEKPFTFKLELPEQLVVSKISEDDAVNMLLSSDPISPEDLSEYGSPIIILNGTVFKRSKEGEEIKYWISIHGLQLRFTGRDDFLADVSTIWIGLAKQ